MDGAFVGAEEPGAHLNAAGSQHEGRRHAPAVGNAAGGNHRQIGGIADLRHQHHGGQFAHMAAAFAALGNQGRGPQPGHQLGHGHRGHHRNDLDACFLPGAHILGGVAGTGGHHLHLFFHSHLGYLIGKGAHQHDVHADGLVGQISGNPDLLADIIRRGVACGNNTKAAAI